MITFNLWQFRCYLHVIRNEKEPFTLMKKKLYLLNCKRRCTLMGNENVTCSRMWNVIFSDNWTLYVSGFLWYRQVGCQSRWSGTIRKFCDILFLQRKKSTFFSCVFFLQRKHLRLICYIFFTHQSSTFPIFFQAMKILSKKKLKRKGGIFGKLFTKQN